MYKVRKLNTNALMPTGPNIIQHATQPRVVSYSVHGARYMYESYTVVVFPIKLIFASNSSLVLIRSSIPLLLVALIAFIR